MLVFIDESGCPGFKFARGSDPVFGIGMVVFSTGADARLTEQAMMAVRERTGHKPEFKFSKSSDELRDAFFASVRSCPFTVRAMIVRKDSVYNPRLRSSGDSFYRFFAKSLMAHDDGTLASARVRIDGAGSQEFQRSLCAYLRRELGKRIKDVRMSDSERDPLMQLADMCIGAVTRAERDRANADRWRKMLAPRIVDVWRFR